MLQSKAMDRYNPGNKLEELRSFFDSQTMDLCTSQECDAVAHECLSLGFLYASRRKKATLLPGNFSFFQRESSQLILRELAVGINIQPLQCDPS